MYRALQIVKKQVLLWVWLKMAVKWLVYDGHITVSFGTATSYVQPGTSMGPLFCWSLDMNTCRWNCSQYCKGVHSLLCWGGGWTVLETGLAAAILFMLFLTCYAAIKLLLFQCLLYECVQLFTINQRYLFYFWFYWIFSIGTAVGWGLFQKISTVRWLVIGHFPVDTH